jgi:flagellar motility protein MotE (MotC chaperone)
MLELAAALQNRSLALEEREKLLKLRETELQDVEKRLIARIEDLKKLRADIGEQLTVAEQQKENKIDELVKMVESNRASAISSMFEALDEDLAVQVLDRMSASKAGKLLAAISPIRAARLAEKMANPIDPATLTALEDPAEATTTQPPAAQPPAAQPPAAQPATPQPPAQTTPPTTPPPTATQ